MYTICTNIKKTRMQHSNTRNGKTGIIGFIVRNAIIKCTANQKKKKRVNITLINSNALIYAISFCMILFI